MGRPVRGSKASKSIVSKSIVSTSRTSTSSAATNNNNVDKKTPVSGSKRGRKADPKSGPSAKKVKLSLPSVCGVALSLGQGDTGQLGLGEDIMERCKPAVIKLVDDLVSICGGGMHSLLLDKHGVVYSFGCNDEGSLGRESSSEEDCFIPQKVSIPGKVVMISAGDSHSACLTEDGKAYYWGTFRDSSGSFGLTPSGTMQKVPMSLAHELDVMKVTSGADHLVLLTSKGDIYTLGCGEQGQLGRVGERFTARGGRRGLELLLKPAKIHSNKRSTLYKDVWAGSYNTLALTEEGDLLVCGLNNYHQLGISQGASSTIFSLIKSESFCNNDWKEIALGQHHTLALNTEGKVYALGRNEYGRLGLGTSSGDATVPTLIPTLADKKVVSISCGTAVSFAVTDSGECYSWGMGTNGQLGHDNDDDVWVPKRLTGKQLENRKALMACGGGQHTLILAK